MCFIYKQTNDIKFGLPQEECKLKNIMNKCSILNYTDDINVCRTCFY